MSYQSIIEEYIHTPITQGGRNHALFKAAAACKDSEYSKADAQNTLLNKAQSDGLSYREIMQTIDSAYARPVSDAPKFEAKEKGRDLSWDDDLGGLLHAPTRKIEVYKAEIPPPSSNWTEDLKRLLTSAFSPEENIQVVKDVFERDGKFVPAGRGDTLSVKALLERSSEEFNQWVGHSNGAYMRINPMDGQGASDKNVTAFRHVLVESDTLPMEQQLSIYRELQLPVSGLIHSGGKSIHAWVRVDAENQEQYKKRCAYVYEALEAQGFEIDHSNKNPSRLSRLVGVRRGQGEQYLISERGGQPDFETWVRWLEQKANDLPEIESFDAIMREDPPLAPVLIDGMLRQGHKLLIAGPSKAGKTFWLINLALSLNAGKPFFGFPVKKSSVLFANFEVDRASFYNRVRNVGEALGITDYSNIDVWNLRGRSAGIEELAPQIIRNIKERNYGAVILDPTYKFMGERDENNAGDITSMMNYLDQIAVQTNTSIIVASHFSKGKQGDKNQTDRVSGSGVFARDPDAIITLSEVKDEPNGYKMEGTLREFAAFEPVGLRWEWPIHEVDQELAEARVDGDTSKASINSADLIEMFLTINGGDMSTAVPWKQYKESVEFQDAKLRKYIDTMKPHEGLILENQGGYIVLKEVN